MRIGQCAWESLRTLEKQGDKTSLHDELDTDETSLHRSSPQPELLGRAQAGTVVGHETRARERVLLSWKHSVRPTLNPTLSTVKRLGVRDAHQPSRLVSATLRKWPSTQREAIESASRADRELKNVQISTEGWTVVGSNSCSDKH